ncbi:MAG: SpoIIE family protein phosphatase [Leptospiraceae bacterium]|nr:SpoIIE family protein phosphatase [Leptospiraceae bacterium]
MKLYTLIIFFSSVSLFAFPIDLNLGWKVHEGILKSCNEGNDWKEVKKLPIIFSDYEWKRDKEIISLTACLKVNLNGSELETLKENLSLFLPYIVNVHEVYFNQVELVKSGKIENNKIIRNGYLTNINVPIPEHILKAGENEIMITVAGEQYDELAIYSGDNFLLDYNSKNNYKHSERIDLMLLFLYLFVGIYHLVLYFKRSKEVYNFHYAMFCITIAIYFYTRSNAIQELGLDPMIVTRIEYPILFLSLGFSITMLETFQDSKISLFAKIYLVYAGILSFLMTFISHTTSNTLLKVWQMSMPIMLIYLIFIMVRSVVRKHKDSKRLFVGFIVVVICAIVDLVGALRLIRGFENPGIMKYGFFSFVFGIAIVLANKFLRVYNQVEELNESLEHKVTQRTEQLQNTLNEVRELKYQQDGDYFLTSLLIKPLMENNATSEIVNIEFYIKQKKTFEFKNKLHEIGGDICISNRIILKNKNYTIFINGDAMGKSIQGAGGALVLGVVFRAFVSRTKMGAQSDVMPEVWLKHCFLELQNVFVSFDGSMLISVVMGLVEEETGLLYFINAEHPWSVLYRDGKSSFLDNQLITRKIGMMGLDGQLRVQTFQLLAGDIVFIGSDGRDDILLSTDEKGTRKINEDETKFLQYVEKGDGQIAKISSEIMKAGELTDDFTLLKISYHGVLVEHNEDDIIKAIDLERESLEHQEKDVRKFLELSTKSIELNSRNPELIKKIVRSYQILKDFKNAVRFQELYVNQYSIDTEQMITLSYLYKMIGRYKLAVDYGEAVRLRNPLSVRNLVNLSDVYRLLEMSDRSRKILTEALNIEPDNKKALELLSYIDRKVTKVHEEMNN